MTLIVEVVPVMSTHPCDFCLSLQGGSVFADFVIDTTNSVYITRISFDEFGCYEVGNVAIKMNLSDSHLFIEAVNHNKLKSHQIEDILRGYFRANIRFIRSNELSEYDLL